MVRLVCFANAAANQGRIPYRLVLARAGQLVQESDVREGGQPRRPETARRVVDRCLGDLARRHPDALLLDRAGAQQVRFVVLDERRWRGQTQAQWLEWLSRIGATVGRPVTARWLYDKGVGSKAMAGRWFAGTAVMGEDRVEALAQAVAEGFPSRVPNATAPGREKRRATRLDAYLRQVTSALRVLLGDGAELRDRERAYVLAHALQTLGFCHFILASMEQGLSAAETGRATIYTHGHPLTVPSLPDDAHDLREMSEAAAWLYATAKRNGLCAARLMATFQRSGLPRRVDLDRTVSVGPPPRLLRRLAERVIEKRENLRCGAPSRLAKYLQGESR